ncbi:MAG: hypothetical protein EBU51_07160, partial [Synechococcaceae bacterium WB6_3A_227]|nr:hypothetical protein [Synechococcaceae bacterium WB6_3A_227]
MIFTLLRGEAQILIWASVNLNYKGKLIMFSLLGMCSGAVAGLVAI